MSTITAEDGVGISSKSGGSGPVVTSSHGWSLTCDAWTAEGTARGRSVLTCA
jgi:hypothetical protein